MKVSTMNDLHHMVLLTSAKHFCTNVHTIYEHLTLFVYILAQVMEGRRHKFTAPPSFIVHK